VKTRVENRNRKLRRARHLETRVTVDAGCVNGLVRLSGLDLPRNRRQGGGSMSTTRTRALVQPPLRLALACAFILFVAILILPH
jgi:hypothetical protein